MSRCAIFNWAGDWSRKTPLERPALIMSYAAGYSAPVRERSDPTPSRRSIRSRASSNWSSTGRDSRSILAKLASATLSLFQSMMWRPSMAPARTGAISGMGEPLSTMPPTCWPRLRGALISWRASSVSSRQPGASTRRVRRAGPAFPPAARLRRESGAARRVASGLPGADPGPCPGPGRFP